MTIRRPKIRLLLLPLVIGGCNTIDNAAETAGSYMPVIGDRCEHWQCFTESGRTQSDMIKAQRMQEHAPSAGSSQ